MSDATGDADSIGEIWRLAAARSAFEATMAGKTPEEELDIIIGALCRAVGDLSRQNDALAGLVQKIVAVNGALERRVAALEETGKNVRGPFIRRGL